MIRTIKPKTARAKRELGKRDPKIVENVKNALFVPGKSSNKVLHDVVVDLSSLKKPNMKRFNKKNDILPFEDPSSLEFFSEKNDSSLLVLSSHNKKRPNTLTWIRTFNYKLYDMIELSILNNYKLLNEFKQSRVDVGMKPMFVFNGPIFDSHPVYQHLKSLFLDFYRGEETNLLDLKGLQHVISISAGEIDDVEESISKLPLVHFRVYRLKTYKSPEPKLPRVELDEVGPRLTFKVGRYQSPDPEVEKEALTQPKQQQPKVKKNVQTDIIGDKVAQVHVGSQDLSKLQTRKMKGLKKRYDQVEVDNGDEDFGSNKKAKTD
ncbi:Ribosome biogenesis protein RPF2 [Komagataella phaffii CBS 7435]|uniref:Ribosome production factor 2 homolog n=2 Tax=Komagataella phaffii TaxID=460519 RepID=C4R667_KOMPG|nr:Essential protein involved in the processing of pre-rRNA and the assembly of 60S ribosomal subunit [Komagataella phaffii GS115]AOA63251.1 GQ67_04121T0 [Komagataella phaffii]CAH2449109.1 Ribosome biogenesis protein RPF2 [Komagataella phaffii CBS 7435]AOA69197.1 GQ68_04094T0 [Komagataella phaffii GS115]CAY71053.1 Essential protein involved in the processing of pre-rRNA and the assembly of 60S ribosomal subunit [Komagataella phaffii GS115]CCA39151.1 Ribosome biogenesis protein RPF2 [Komagatael